MQSTSFGCQVKNKSFRPPFSKGGSFQRQRLWSSAAAGETPLSFKRLLKGKLARESSLADWGTFCKRKSSQQIHHIVQPRKTSHREVFLGCANRQFAWGLFSYKSPLFCKLKISLQNSPAKALPTQRCFELCGARPAGAARWTPASF